MSSFKKTTKIVKNKSKFISGQQNLEKSKNSFCLFFHFSSKLTSKTLCI